MKFEGTFTFGRVFAKAKTVLKRCAGFKPKPRSGKTEHRAHWAKEKVMTKLMNPRAFGALATLAVAFALTACGGGGGGGTPVVTPPPVTDTTPPVLTLATSSPAALTTTIVVTSNEALGGNVAISVQAPTGATITGSTTLNQGNLGMTWTNQSGAALACNTAYKVTATATDLASNVGTLSASTVTTAGCPGGYWNPKPTFIPQGTSMTAPNQLPAGCTTKTQQCWKDAVMNGMVKLSPTTATQVGENSRPIVFAYFKNTSCQFGVCGLWNYLPMYADTGELVGGDINGGVSSEVDPVVTNALGIIVRDKPSNTCYQVAWDATHHVWNVNGNGTNTPVACP